MSTKEVSFYCVVLYCIGTSFFQRQTPLFIVETHNLNEPCGREDIHKPWNIQDTNDFSRCVDNTTSHLPPTTYKLPSTSYHLPPTTYHQPPTTYLKYWAIMMEPGFSHFTRGKKTYYLSHNNSPPPTTYHLPIQINLFNITFKQGVYYPIFKSDVSTGL